MSGVSGWGLKPPASTLRGKKVTSSQSASSEGLQSRGWVKSNLDVTVLVCACVRVCA